MDSLQQSLSSERPTRNVDRWTKAAVISVAAVLALLGTLSLAGGQHQAPAVAQDQVAAVEGFAEKKEQEGSCQYYHCGVFNPKNKCQCNAACGDFDSCCSDFKMVCVDHKLPTLPPKPVVFDPDMMWQSTLMRAAMKQQMVLASGKEDTRHEQEDHLEAAEKAMLARQKAADASEEDSQMPTEQDITDARKKAQDAEKEKHAQKKVKEENVTNTTSAWHSIARSSFLDSISDLLGDSPNEDKKLREAATKTVLKREKTEQTELEKEREKEKKEKKEQEKKEEEAKKKLKEAKEALREWSKEEKLQDASLYCFALMMPFGYEPNLLFEQEKRGVGMFGCDERMVFSNVSTLLNGAPSPVDVHVFDANLAVAYGGKWMTALNTGVFNKLWMEVIRLERYRHHDWVVKVDPDAVFFADRLRQLLRHTKPYNEIPSVKDYPSVSGDNCRTCALEEHQYESCASHVRWWQQNNHTCSEALKLVARAPPMDCGCDCDDFACEQSDAAIYLNNCKWGLHGPIEVLSRRAVAIFAAGLPRCMELLEHPWGEDKFLDHCLQLLGVNRDNEYDLLSETACGEQPAPCGTSNVAFHPFKSIQSYFTCHAYAGKYGHGPVTKPSFEDFAKEAGVKVDGSDDEDMD